MYSGDYDEMEVPTSVSIGGGTIYWPSLLSPYIKLGSKNAVGVFYCPSAADSFTKTTAPDPLYITAGSGFKTCTFYGGATSGDSSTNALVPDEQKPGQLSLSMNAIGNSYATSNTNDNGWKTGTFAAGVPGRYGYNKGNNTPGPDYVPIAVADVQDPAGTIHIFDAMTGANSAGPGSVAGNGSAMCRIKNEQSTDRYKDAETTKPTYRHSGGFNALYGDGHAHWRPYGRTTPCEWSVQDDPYPTDSAAIQAACKK